MPAEKAWSNDPPNLFPKAMSRPGAPIWASKHVFHEEGLELHRKIADYKARTGNDPRNGRITENILVQKITKEEKINVTCQKYSEAR